MLFSKINDPCPQAINLECEYIAKLAREPRLTVQPPRLPRRLKQMLSFFYNFNSHYSFAYILQFCTCLVNGPFKTLNNNYHSFELPPKKENIFSEYLIQHNIMLCRFEFHRMSTAGHRWQRKKNQHVWTESWARIAQDCIDSM